MVVAFKSHKINVMEDIIADQLLDVKPEELQTIVLVIKMPTIEQVAANFMEAANNRYPQYKLVQMTVITAFEQFAGVVEATRPQGRMILNGMFVMEKRT